jgi:hypothetical protein
VSSPSLSTSSADALALMGQYKRDVIEAQLAGDATKAKIARDSFRLVAWMDSIPGDQLLIELFGYSAHVTAWVEDQRRGWNCHFRKSTCNPQPKPSRQRKPSIKKMIAAAERAGKNVTSITTPDGTTLHFGEVEDTETSNPWLVGIDNKVIKQ